MHLGRPKKETIPPKKQITTGRKTTKDWFTERETNLKHQLLSEIYSSGTSRVSSAVSNTNEHEIHLGEVKVYTRPVISLQNSPSSCKADIPALAYIIYTIENQLHTQKNKTMRDKFLTATSIKVRAQLGVVRSSPM